MGMLEGKEGGESPYKKEVIKHLHETAVNVIDPYDPRLGALTWTSEERLRRMLSSGYLPGQADISSEKEIIGIALPGLASAADNLPINGDIQEFLSHPDEAGYYAAIHAEHTAGTDYFLTQFGLPLDNPRISETVSNYIFHSDEKRQEFITAISGTPELAANEEIDASVDILSFLPPEVMDRIPLVAEEARRRKGVVIGIPTQALLPDRILGLVTPEDYFVRFNFGEQGMHFKNIAVNKPEGEHEKAFYESLKRGNSNL